MKKILIIGAIALCFSSCLVFKTYNSAARYKDNTREIVLTTDTTIIVGNKAAKSQTLTITTPNN